MRRSVTRPPLAAVTTLGLFQTRRRSPHRPATTPFGRDARSSHTPPEASFSLVASALCPECRDLAQNFEARISLGTGVLQSDDFAARDRVDLIASSCDSRSTRAGRSISYRFVAVKSPVSRCTIPTRTIRTDSRRHSCLRRIVRDARPARGTPASAASLLAGLQEDAEATARPLTDRNTTCVRTRTREHDAI